jgi:acetyl-CoA carboxylase, biotin carboxylase subunit
MIAKLIVHGEDRADALARLRLALDEMSVSGISTNLQLHRRIASDAAFSSGAVDIHYLERRLRQGASHA